MDYYCLNIEGLIRKLPFIDINDKLAYASFVVISDSELVCKVAPLLAQKIKNCDVIVTAEAKGIALAHEISKCLNLKRFVVARKSIKSYMKDPISIPVKSITTTNVQNLYLDDNDVTYLNNKNVCLLDDVVSTGGSLKALEDLMNKVNATVISKACILAEGDAADRDDLIFLKKLPLFEKVNGTYKEIL